ncbi:MAG TPA: nitroreductase family protein, partial [Chitinispirillaceae bacterium]|nr:nitroreductase family protein [Chitinispirillaceae bacterium]
MNRIVIDERTCRKCNLCVEICPNRILMRTDDAICANVNKIGVCFKCGQCMAICPAKSISVDGLSYSKDFFDLPEMQIKPEYFSNLISTRRAIRNFKEKPVEKELLNEIVKAISLAPPGFPPLKYDLVVVQNSTVIRQALPYMIQLYDFLVNAMNNPIKRIFIKKEVGGLRFRTLKEHLIPLLKMSLPDLKNGTEDTLTRNAPAMILFLADTTGEDITEDIHIAATFGILSAHALGLGASIMDIIPPAINKKKELRKMFGLTENQEVI